MQVPRIQKITLNMGVGEAKTDAKALDAAIEELTTIAGQRAQMRRARKSIAGFKLREGMPVGARVTLRGARMWEFLDRLVSIALPRIRDFRGPQPELVRRARQLLARHPRADHLPGDRLRLDRRDPRPRRRDHDHAQQDDEQARALLRGLGLPFAQTRRKESAVVAKKSLIEKPRAAALQGARVHALQPLRPPARGLPQVRPLPDLPARARAPGRHPRHDEVELVGAEMLTDPIADMLTRIRNANKALHERVEMPTSRLKDRDRPPPQGGGLHQGLPTSSARSETLRHARRRAQVRPQPRARHHRPQARLEARPPRLRAQGPPAARARRHGHRDPVHLNGLVTSRTAAEQGVGGEVICFVW